MSILAQEKIQIEYSQKKKGQDFETKVFIINKIIYVVKYI